MVKVMFKNLAKSEFIENIITERIGHILSKFPGAEKATATAIVSMENSQWQAGPDLFQVKLILFLKGMKPFVLQKQNSNVYQAVAILADRLFESLHRFFERRRDRHKAERRQHRRWVQSGLLPSYPATG